MTNAWRTDLFQQSGTGAVTRTVQSKEQDIISAFDFLTDAEKTDVLARTYGQDVSTNLQKAWDRGNAIGAEIWHPPGGYLANNLTWRDETVIRGPLVNRGSWWDVTNRGAVIKNTHATNSTINGATGGSAQLASAITGMVLWISSGTGTHIALPDGSNNVLIRGNSMQGGGTGIKSTGTVYDVTIDRNFFHNQSSHCIWHSNSTGVSGINWHITANYFRAMTGSCFRADGSDSLLNAVFDDNICDSPASTADYVDFVKAGNGFRCQGNDLETMGGWAITWRGNAAVFGPNKMTGGVNGVRWIGATNSIMMPQMVGSLSGTTFSIDATSDSSNYVLWPGITVTNASTGPNISSGTYTPTLTNTTNLSASTAYVAAYLRVGNTVTVSGTADVDPVAAAATEVGISLPIASSFSATTQCAGTMADGATESGRVWADATNDRARASWTAVDTAAHTISYTFTYQIV